METGLIKLKDFAKALGKTERTVKSWRDKGYLPANIFKPIGDSLYIIEKKYKEWLDTMA